MAWVKLDDQFPDHPKVVEVGPLAGWLYICGLAYCARYLTDGVIPAAQVRRLADVDDVTPLVTALLTVGLWCESPDGYTVHDYLDYNPPAEKVRAERASNAKRQARHREKRADRPETVSNPSGNAVTSAVTDGGSSPVPSPSPSPSPSPTVSLGSNDPKETSGAAAPTPPKREKVRRVYEPESNYYRLAALLGKRVAENVPQAGAPKEQQLQQWADIARLMVERDNRSVAEIARVLKWSQSHHFWHRHILNMQKLREKYLQLCADMAAEENDGGSPTSRTDRPARGGAGPRADHHRAPLDDFDGAAGLRRPAAAAGRSHTGA